MIYKIINLFLFIYFVEVINWVLNTKKINIQKTKNHNSYALVVLAPLVWLQGIGQLHVDGIIMILITGMIYTLMNVQIIFSAILLSIILASKLMYGAVLLPFYFIFLLCKLDYQYLVFLKKGSTAAIVLLTSFILFYYPVWEGLPTITTTIKYHEEKTPSRSHVDVLTNVIFYGKKIFNEKQSQLEISNNIKKDKQLNNEKKNIYLPLTRVFKVLGLCLGAFVFLGVFFRRNEAKLLHIFGKLFIVVFCFYSPIFHPWYLLLTLPFFIFTKEKSWAIFITLTYSFCNFYEIGFSIPKDNPLFFLSLAFVVLMVLSFFIYFRKHFIVETFKNLDRNL